MKLIRQETFTKMSKSKLLLPIFILLHLHSFSQDFGFKYPGDTLAFSPSIVGTPISSLDSVQGEIIDTFVERRAFLFKNKQDSIIHYSIVVKRDDNYLLYPILSCNAEIGILTEVFIRRGNYMKLYVDEIIKYKFKDSADSFLIFRFSDNTLFSNSSGFEKKDQGYWIWNINKMQALQIIYYQEVETWPYGDGMVATNSGMVTRNGFDVFFEKGELITIVDDKKYRYHYKDGSLIRIN